MKKLILTIMIAALSYGILSAQDNQTKAQLPSVSVKTLDGKTIKASEFSNEGKPFVICFWATWCKP
ncbi:MAG: redoxin domain-containing protein, partial [Bacteroidales bacterium]|nr:redoxin domain-containing protein [Bacteroidales bacterium]